MSEFHVTVVALTNVQKHPNADTLSTGLADGYPVIFRTGEYAEGGKAAYVPIDSLVPGDDPRWAFLQGHNRIKAKKLRGIFSMGLLTQADDAWELGQDVAAELRIEKYTPPSCSEEAALRNGLKVPDPNNDVDPGICPVYDIEGLRKYGGILVEGEEVWISEKIHGQNARFVHDGERMHIASRNYFKKPDSETTWTVAARDYDLEAKLERVPGIAIYGESYGNNSDMPYGVERKEGDRDRLVFFDAYDTKMGLWFGVDAFLRLMADLELPTVPTLYRGPWRAELSALAEGKTTMPFADHVREGIVVKPVEERWDARVGRVFLKQAGEGYLLRKGA